MKKGSNSNKLLVGILGVGEIGSALLALTARKHQVLVKDLNKDTLRTRKINILHICIPYSGDFERTFLRQLAKNRPALTIIESTIPLGTSEKLVKLAKRPIVHSPIRGMHPNLTSGLANFVKFIGATNLSWAKQAKNYYQTIGIKAQILSSCRETELGKLLDTTYYALCIAWHQEMARFCKKHQVEFEEAVTLFNKTYNLGYKKTKPNVIRPVLFPGFIGGHCLMSNIKLLKKSVKSSILDFIENSNKKLKRKS